MSKSRNKNRSEVEYLKGEIRRLKSELKYYKKHHQTQDNDDFIEEQKPDSNTCEHCGKGVLTTIDLKFLKIVRCNVCTYEEKIRY